MPDQSSLFTTTNDKKLKAMLFGNYQYPKDEKSEFAFAVWNVAEWQDVKSAPRFTFDPQTGLTEELRRLVDPTKVLEYIASIHWELSEIKSDLNLLRNQIRSLSEIEEETVVLRTIPDEQAKEEIIKLFSETSDVFYYGDIAEKLKLDLRQVVKIANELEEEGFLVEADVDTEEETQR